MSSLDEDKRPELEIMVPLIISEAELVKMKTLIMNHAEQWSERTGKSVTFKFGTMIETPRSALVADQLSQHIEFMSFGTNDMTQTTLGVSRDDAGSFLTQYVSEGLLKVDPFVSLDQDGVGQLLQIACERALKANKNIKIGLCGEHGGDPESIKFADTLGMNYVSCSPFRLPIARLAAAQHIISS
jgi:pyruvate,orthophosphate dikinase